MEAIQQNAFDNLEGATYEPVKNIGTFHIGDEVCTFAEPEHKVWLHGYIVALFADAGTLGYQSEDYIGTIYVDFPDNPGDVLEFDLATDKVFKITRA